MNIQSNARNGAPVIFIGSAETWSQAAEKGASASAPNTTIVIYEQLRLAPQIVLSRRDVDPGDERSEGTHLVYTKRIGFDVFRVPVGYDPKALAKEIDSIVGQSGQAQNPPSGVEPR
jgi:hypothetical protein